MGAIFIVAANFTNNSAYDGGALYIETDGDDNCRERSLPNRHVNGANATFDGNVAKGEGGAIYLIANSGTALLARLNISASNISASNISDFIPDGANNNEDDVLFENSNFTSNTASISGGAWHVKRARIRCRNCRFSGNANDDSIDSNGGAIALTEQAAFHGRSVFITDNVASKGGGIYASNSLVDIMNSSIDGNDAKSKGGGTYIDIPRSSPFQFGIFARLQDTRMDGNYAQNGGTNDSHIVMKDKCHL